MAVITISVEESEVQVIDGIPKYLTLEVSIPSTIFYTLDGSDPDISSSVYTNLLYLPTSGSFLEVKFFATNGADSSAIISKTYFNTLVGDRRPHDSVQNALSETNNLFPFGGSFQAEPSIFGPIAGLVVDDANVPNVTIDGYDSDGNPVGGTDLELDQYDLIFSTSNSRGVTGRGIGTLPATVSVRIPESVPQTSNVNSKIFNPKALVIYQDSTDAQNDPDLVFLNKQFFSFQDSEKARSGALLYSTGLEGNPLTGSFVKSHFNSAEQKITYYYFDGATNRWIISKEPYLAAAGSSNLSQMVFSRNSGVGMVFKWVPFMSRKLG